MSPNIALYVLDPLERAGRTFLQQFFVVLGTAGAAGLLAHQSWLVALDSAGFAAILSILMSVLTFKIPPLPVAGDIAARVVRTFIQSFVGTLGAAHVLSVSQANWSGALAVASTVAITALMTSLVASKGSNGASFLARPGTVEAAPVNK